tara:strand:- start:233 stop:940 length:708 start_codon:yes stop_codon:yes gene_type:complete
MIYESDNGRVEFWDPYPRLNTFENIGINLSAGTDSALLMFFTCRELEKRNSNQKIIPITGVHNLRPNNIWNAEEIVLLFKEWFPSVKWGEHQINRYDKDNQKDKPNKHLEHEISLREKKIVDIILHGRTANPSLEEAKKHNLLYKREERRDRHGNKRKVYHENHNRPFYCPFEFVDKKFISDMYHQYNLMDELFPITASCVAYAKTTNHFSEPCKECWWCREKKWAFGMYDGGII